MIISLADVKQFNKYDYYRAVDPTTSEKTPTYLNGVTWLNTVTGDSFQLTDESAGTWVQIEVDTDQQIALAADDVMNMVLTEINNPCYVPRNAAYDAADGIPDDQDPDDVRALVENEALFSQWGFDSSAGITPTGDIYGNPLAFLTDDVIRVVKGRRNNGYFTVKSYNSGTGIIEVNESIKSESAYAFIFLVEIPDGLRRILGRMIHYDVFTRPNQTGMQSERIGSYSYTVTPGNSTLDYPGDVTAGLSAYEGASCGGRAYRVV